MPPTCPVFERELKYYRDVARMNASFAQDAAELEALLDAKDWAEELNATWAIEKVAMQAKVDAARQRNSHKLPIINAGAKASLEESMRRVGLEKRKRKRSTSLFKNF